MDRHRQILNDRIYLKLFVLITAAIRLTSQNYENKQNYTTLLRDCRYLAPEFAFNQG